MNSSLSPISPGPGSDQPRPLRVRLTMPMMPSDCALPIPGGGRVWRGCEFVVNDQDDAPCDFWVVMGFAHARESAFVAPENTLFICGEPPAKKLFPRAFYRQFHRVVDTHNHSRHPDLQLHAPCLGWGVKGDYDDLDGLVCPHKINKIGVVCSSTAKTRGQRKRLRFLEEVKARLGDQVVQYGRGFTPVDNKMDAILPYRYQLVLENSVSPHYWTEKLADAFLGWAHPLYVGCPNVGDYFADEALTPIAYDDVKGAVARMQRLLDTPETEAGRLAIATARRQMLDDYNPIARCAELARTWYKPLPARRVEIRTYKAFRWLDRLFPIRAYPGASVRVQ